MPMNLKQMIKSKLFEVEQPQSEGEKNFKALHRAVNHKNLVPGITDQDHIFNGSTKPYDNKHNVGYKPGEDRAAYDKTLKLDDKETDNGYETAKVEEQIGSRIGPKGSHAAIRNVYEAKWNESVNENYDDTPEEVSMVRTELKAIVADAQSLLDNMPSDMHIEPWVQSKIAVAKSMVCGVHDYMLYSDDDDKPSDMRSPMPSMSNPFSTNEENDLDEKLSPEQLKKFAKLAPPRDKITYADKIVAVKKKEAGQKILPEASMLGRKCTACREGHYKKIDGKMCCDECGNVAKNEMKEASVIKSRALHGAIQAMHKLKPKNKHDIHVKMKTPKDTLNMNKEEVEQIDEISGDLAARASDKAQEIGKPEQAARLGAQAYARGISSDFMKNRSRFADTQRDRDNRMKTAEEVEQGNYFDEAADLTKIDTKTLETLTQLHKHYGQKNPAAAASAKRGEEELKRRMKKEEVEQVDEKMSDLQKKTVRSIQNLRFKLHKDGHLDTKPSISDTKRTIRFVKNEEVEQFDEILKASDSVGKWIDDFTHSKDPKFNGKSKEERRKMALGAYYGAQKESYENSTEELAEGRGRPPKEGSKAYLLAKEKEAKGENPDLESDRNIINQFRKKPHVNDNGKLVHHITFADKEKHEIPKEHVDKAMNLWHSAIKPAQKLEIQRGLEHSKDSFHHTIKHGKPPEKIIPPKVSLGKMKAESVNPSTTRADLGHIVSRKVRKPDGSYVIISSKKGTKKTGDIIDAQESYDLSDEVTNSLNNLYNSLSEQNKELFEERIMTEEGVFDLINFARKQGF